MRNVLGLLFRRSAYRVGEGMRGRVHKISIIAGGEVSIVIRCGMDEPRARQLLQGSLVEFFETREGAPPKESVEMAPGAEPEAAATAPPAPGEIRVMAPGVYYCIPCQRDVPDEHRAHCPALVDLGKVSDTGKPPAPEDTQ